MSRASTFHGGGVPRDRLTFAMDHGPAHMRPIIGSVRDYGCAWMSIAQDAGAFDPPTDSPCILVIGDDTASPRGPAAFHVPSLRRFLARCGSAVIVSCEPLPALYGSAATCAALARRDVLLIESQPRWEADWADLVRSAAPGLPLLIGAVRPPTEVRH